MQSNLFSFFGKKEAKASSSSSQKNDEETKSGSVDDPQQTRKTGQKDSKQNGADVAAKTQAAADKTNGKSKPSPTKQDFKSPGDRNDASREPANEAGKGVKSSTHDQKGEKTESQSLTPAKSPSAVNEDSDSDDVTMNTGTVRKKLRRRADKAPQKNKKESKENSKGKKKQKPKANISESEESEDESSEFSGSESSSGDESMGSFVVGEEEADDGPAQSDSDSEDIDTKPKAKKTTAVSRKKGASASVPVLDDNKTSQAHKSFMERIEAEANSGVGAGESMAEVASNIAQKNRLGHSWGYGRTKQGYSPDIKSEMARKKYGYGGTKITDDTAKRSGMYPAGEHMHDTLPWLYEDRKDANGRPQGHPEFNPRTLHVPKDFLDNKKFCTPAGRQWWEFKSQNMDTLLCFKQGKFYELFHMDADVLARELDCIYMKGFQAHAGFPESAYGRFSEQLVDRGFRVSRVEQTETPQELAERKKVTKGPKPQVVRRELCGIKSRGTRLHGDMDFVRTPEDGSVNISAIGRTNHMEQWLIAIKECSLGQSNSDGESDDATHFGVCCVDTATYKVVLTEFVDDPQRTKLRTLLARMPPAELLYVRGTLTEPTERFLRYDASRSVHTEVSNEEINPKAVAGQSPEQVGVKLPKGYNGEAYSPQAAIMSCINRQYFASEEKVSIEEGIPAAILDRFPWTMKLAAKNAQQQNWEIKAPHEQAEQNLGALTLSAFGIMLYHLQRCLIERELLTARQFATYTHNRGVQWQSATSYETHPETEEEAVEIEEGVNDIVSAAAARLRRETDHSEKLEMDANTLLNLEILENSYDGGSKGTLFSILDGAFTAFGRRTLRDWVTKPLLLVSDIEKRLCAVENLMGIFPVKGDNTEQNTLCQTGILTCSEESTDSAAVEEIRSKADQVRSLLSGMPDIERILARIHRNSSKHLATQHPQSRAMMYEAETYSKRKMKDLTTALRGFRAVQKIRNLFVEDSKLHTGVVSSYLKAVIFSALPDLSSILEFFDNAFDPKDAEKFGYVVPRRGVDDAYDKACDEISEVKQKLEDYRKSQEEQLKCKIKYVDMMKDRYLLEISESAASRVPNTYEVKSQRKGKDPVRRFWTPRIESYLEELATAEQKREEALRDSTRALFQRFDAHRGAWNAAVTCMSILDALLAMAYWSENGDGAGTMCRPELVSYEDSEDNKNLGNEWPKSSEAFTDIKCGRHPCITVGLQDGSGSTMGFSSYVPNDVVLGKERTNEPDSQKSEGSRGVNEKQAPCVLLTGPNMGGKSTLLRQTCMATILAQLGGYVPAEKIRLTPVDRIFTRVGASDRILAGQSTFFVELAETSTILHNASSRSLVILDELGRGTSTFDGNAIAYAVTRNLTKKIGARTLFATHYHTLCEEFEHDPQVDMAHMACMVEDGNDNASSVTFLYQLKHGACPKSYGLNVARLARLPEEVIQRAKEKSEEFEKSLETVMQLEKRPKVGTKRKQPLDDNQNVVHESSSADISPYGASQLLGRFLSTVNIGDGNLDNPDETVMKMDDALLLSFWSEAHNLGAKNSPV